MRLTAFNCSVHICRFYQKFCLIISIVELSSPKYLQPILTMKFFSQQIMHIFALSCELSDRILLDSIIGSILSSRIDRITSSMSKQLLNKNKTLFSFAKSEQDNKDHKYLVVSDHNERLLMSKISNINLSIENSNINLSINIVFQAQINFQDIQLTELNQFCIKIVEMIRKYGKMKKFGAATLLLVLSAKAYEIHNQSYMFSRVLRTVKCGLHILYSYKIAFDENNYLDIHDAVAKDIYETCIQNDGLYVKFGQGIASMDHLLPPPFFKHMSKLQDKAKSVEYPKIAKLFEQEVGKKIEDCFLKFDKQPIASASLAQVHKATLKDGRQVAVKVQKPRIKAQFSTDMAMHYLINYVLEYAFDLPLLHFVDDIQNNLQKQLDFRIEASNAKRAEHNFKQLKRKQLHVPQIIDEFTRQRVMVSEWIDGIKITDEQALKKMGFSKKQIMNKIIRAFADQIFVTGFVHCDPHPGNIFVRPNPQKNKDFQIVILDHGLCLELSDDFRASYSTFWKSMFLHDEKKMQQVCRSWGLSQTQQFASFQLFRPYSSTKMLNKKVEKEDVIKLQMQLKDKIKQMMKDTINFPKQLIFVGRNMNLVRSLNKYYGGIADRIAIMARSAFIGTTTQKSGYPTTGISYSLNGLWFNIHVLFIEITNWVFKQFSGQYIDEYIQNQSVKQTQKMYDKYGFKGWDESSYNA